MTRGEILSPAYERVAPTDDPPASLISDNPVGRYARPKPVYAALDLGTNNCRLLIARPVPGGFRILDAFSRIVRLGEGLSGSGRLGEAAIARTIAALRICRSKMEARNVNRFRLIATEACRAAENGAAFITRVQQETGLGLEIVDRETEAHLAAAGCAALADPAAKSIVLFDIGGGSSELVLLKAGQGELRERVGAWASLPLGVVSLAEKHGGHQVTRSMFEAMVDEVAQALQSFRAQVNDGSFCDKFHLLGTSGTVTTIAGVHLGLERYDRRKVDGLWMEKHEIDAILSTLLEMSYADRAANACIGPERADLVLAGCAILEAIRRAFPAKRLRIADRGLREGILMDLMVEDGWRMNGARS